MHELQIRNVVFLGLEDLEEDGLSFNLVLAQHLSGLLRHQAIPLLICVRKLVLLE